MSDRSDSPGALDADALMALRHAARAWPPLELGPSGRPGGFVAPPQGSGLDIRDLRPFEEGDDIRHIDANATARTGRFHARSFHDEQDRAVWLVADFRRPMLWGTAGRLRSAAGAGLLALTGWRAVAAGGDVGLLAFGGSDLARRPPRPRATQMARLVGDLCAAHQAALSASPTAEVPPLDIVLARLAGQVARGSTVVLASGMDAPGDALPAAVAAILRRARLMILRPRDRLERQPPDARLPCITGPGGLRWMRFGRAGTAPDPGPVLTEMGAELVEFASEAPFDAPPDRWPDAVPMAADG